MSDLKYPKITYPFSPTINSFANDVQQWSKDWGEQLNLFQIGSFKHEGFEKIKSGYLVARIHPHATFADLILASDYGLLTFVLDDYCDEVNDISKINDYLGNIIKILKGNDIERSNEVPNLFGWNDWWERVKKTATSEWQQRFIDNMTNYLDSQIWEIKNRNNKQIPSINDYLIKRQYTGGTLTFFDLIEVVDNAYLPSAAINSTLIELKSAANNIVNWANDIMSLEKELAVGEVHNLVICLSHHHQIPVQEALNRTLDMHNLELEKYLKLEKKLFEQGDTFKKEYEKYTYGLRAVIRGNLDWSIESDRYHFVNS